MEHFNVFGLKVSNFLISEIEQLYDQTVHTDKNVVIYGYSFGTIPTLKKDKDLYPIANSFDVLVCDGTYFNWFCTLFGFKLKTVISIPDTTNYTLEYANKNRLKVLLFGATKEINQKANLNLSIKYPDVQFLEGIDGYFAQSDEKNIVDRINQASPDVLLIGISSPIKERFAYKYKNELKAHIIIPCGGMIDVFAEKTKQTPSWFKKMGFATLCRIIQEPRRMFFRDLWITYEIFCKFLPLAFFYRCVLQRKDFNLIKIYLK